MACGAWLCVRRLPVHELHQAGATFQSPLYPGSTMGTIWEAPEAPSLPEPESPELRPAPLQPPSSLAPPVRDGTETNTSSAFIVPLSPTGQR